jgi:hypothetical protein
LRSKKNRKRGKALDLAIWKEALKDGRVWTKLGVVTKFEGESAYWEWSDDGQVLIDVELSGSQERVLCRLATPAGFWVLPAEGAEVIVVVPDGDLDADPVIVGVMAKTGPIGDLTDQRSIHIIVPEDTTVEIHSTPGTAAELATKADVDAIQTALDAHEHLYIPYPGGVAGSPVPTEGGPAVPAPTGTIVLKAE